MGIAVGILFVGVVELEITLGLIYPPPNKHNVYVKIDQQYEG